MKDSACAALVPLLLMQLTTGAQATSFKTESFNEAVDHASRVAVIEITSAKPIFARRTGDKVFCGVRYFAKVIADYKGGTNEFRFFSQNESFFKGYSINYLIVARDPPRSGLNSKSLKYEVEVTNSAVDERDEICAKYTTKGLYVDRIEQRIFPIREDVKLGGKAIEVVSGYPFAGLFEVGTVQSNFDNREMDACITQPILFRFFDVERLIRQSTEKK